MRVKSVVAEDFLNYKEPAMFITSVMCDWKCCREYGRDDICQNKELVDCPTINVSNEAIYNLYHSSDIAKAVVIGGLEPFLQIDEIVSLIKTFRSQGETCPFIIYTGYEPEEIQRQLKMLRQFENIIVKFGRYLPSYKARFDELLGVTLASENQYALRL